MQYDKPSLVFQSQLTSVFLTKRNYSMSIIRIEKSKDHPYSMIANSFVNDGRISLQALGLGVYFLSKMDRWQINVKHLISVRKEGRDAIYAIINELKAYGYMRTDIIRDAKGQFERRELVFCEDACVAYSHLKREENKKLNEYADSLSHPDPENPEMDEVNTAYPLPAYPDPAYPEEAKPETYINTNKLLNTDKKQILKEKEKKLDQKKQKQAPPPSPLTGGESDAETSDRKGVRIKPSEVIAVFETWQKVFHHPNSKLDKARRNFIVKALRMGYSIEDLSTAVLGCSLTPHNIGYNERGQIYDGIHIIFKDADQIDRFIKNYANPPVQKTKKELEWDRQTDQTATWAERKRAKIEERENAQQ